MKTDWLQQQSVVGAVRLPQMEHLQGLIEGFEDFA